MEQSDKNIEEIEKKIAEKELNEKLIFDTNESAERRLEEQSKIENTQQIENSKNKEVPSNVNEIAEQTTLESMNNKKETDLSDKSRMIEKIDTMNDMEKDKFFKESPERFKLLPHDLANLKEQSLPNDKMLQNDKILNEYNEYYQKVLDNKIEFIQYEPEHIDIKEIYNPDEKTMKPTKNELEYWTNHGNKPEDYQRLAKQYSDIQSQLDNGKTIEELNRNPELKDGVNFWFSEGDKIKAVKYNDSMFLDGSGRHRNSLAEIYNIDTNIEVSLHEAREKK